MEQKMRLIDAAVDLYHEKPWDLFDAHEVFELDKVPFAQHVYCLFTMNSGRKCIRFYHGVESFYDISDDFKPMDNVRVDLFHRYEHDFYEVIFDDPAHLSESYREAGQQLGLSDREIPVMLSQKKRHFISGLDEIDEERLDYLIHELHDAMSLYLREGHELDFNKRRFVYDVKKKSSSSKKTAYRPRKYDVVEIDDDELMHQLSELEVIDEIWEFDLQVTDSIVFASEGDLSSPVYLAALANVLDQQMLAAVPFEPFGDLQFQCIDLMVEAFMQRGLPKGLVVRHPLVGSAMMDLTRKLNINLMPVEGFEMLDDFVDGLDQFMNQNKEIN